MKRKFLTLHIDGILSGINGIQNGIRKVRRINSILADIYSLLQEKEVTELLSINIHGLSAEYRIRNKQPLHWKFISQLSIAEFRFQIAFGSTNTLKWCIELCMDSSYTQYAKQDLAVLNLE